MPLEGQFLGELGQAFEGSDRIAEQVGADGLGAGPQIGWQHRVRVEGDAPDQGVEPLIELPQVGGDPARASWAFGIGRGGVDFAQSGIGLAPLSDQVRWGLAGPPPGRLVSRSVATSWSGAILYALAFTA